jgi:hypothetical protein
MRLDITLVAGGVALTVLPLAIVSEWFQNRDRRISAIVRDGYAALARAEEERVARMAEEARAARCASLEALARQNLRIARHLLEQSGGYSVSLPHARAWNVVPAAGGGARKVLLPGVLIGEIPLAGPRRPGPESPFVDEVSRLTGAGCSIYQRMNRAGDMLCVATSLRQPGGRRAVGAYIAARGPSGAPNPILQSVLSGAVYLDRSFDAGAWRIVAYEPIEDPPGRVAGMLSAGAPDSAAPGDPPRLERPAEIDPRLDREMAAAGRLVPAAGHGLRPGRLCRAGLAANARPHGRGRPRRPR